MAEKKLPNSVEAQRAMIETNHPTLSIRRQCELVSLNRASYYWQPTGESSLNLQLMRLIDQEYTGAPFYGYRKMTVRLNTLHGYHALTAGLDNYFHLYNYERPHQSLEDRTLAIVYQNRLPSVG